MTVDLTTFPDPATPLLDDFNYAATNPLGSSRGWLDTTALDPAVAPGRLRSNGSACVGQAASSGSGAWGTALGANFETYATLSWFQARGWWLPKVVNPGTPAATAYAVPSGTDSVGGRLPTPLTIINANGPGSGLIATIATDLSFNPGDVLGFRFIEVTPLSVRIDVWRQRAGVWTKIHQFNDHSGLVIGNGYVGASLSSFPSTFGTTTIDDLFGAPLVLPASTVAGNGALRDRDADFAWRARSQERVRAGRVAEDDTDGSVSVY